MATKITNFFSSRIVYYICSILNCKLVPGLIGVNKDLQYCQEWIAQRMNKDQKVGEAHGKLRSFIIEPFVPHQQHEEVYVCIFSHRHADTILFHHEGGVDVGDVDAKAVKLEVPVGETTDAATIERALLANVKDAKKKAMLTKFIYALYKLYTELYFTYLEINPLVVTDSEIYMLDLAAKLDSTADFICRTQWGEIDYPPPFGRDAFPGTVTSFKPCFVLKQIIILHNFESMY